MKLLKLPKEHKGLVANGHKFDKDRTLLMSDENAVLAMKVLGPFFGVTQEHVEEQTQPSDDDSNGENTSLTTEQTKA